MFRSLGKTARDPRSSRLVPGVFPPWFVLALVLLPAGLRPAYASPIAPHGDQPPEAKPVARIPVGPLGYLPPGSLFLLSRMSFSSLAFVDSHHLLFTFRESRLLKRAPDALPSDDDQMIRALVLALPDGRISAAADWRMHDRGRYLWQLGGGRFLVRQRNAYSVTDSQLKLHGWIASPTPVQATEVSPDGRLLVIENVLEQHTPAEHAKLSALAERLGEAPPAEKTNLALVTVDTRVMEAELRAELPVRLPVTSSGYVTVKDTKNNEYVLHFVPFHGEPVLLGGVASTCLPKETFLSETALMIESCGPNTSDVLLDAWTTDGKKLWSGRRDQHAVWPTFAMALDGSRFAIGLLRISVPINLDDSLNDENVKEQVVQVFDTKTGSLLLTTNASPILTAGQNFALSPDGNRLAVLREGAIEVYDVPTASPTPSPK